MIKIRTFEDKVTLGGIGTFSAKALRWDDLGNGLLSVFHLNEERYLLSRARVELLQDTTGQPLVSDGQSLDEAVEEKVTEQVQALHKAYLWAEENGDLRDNSHQWSFGNGATGDKNQLCLPMRGLITQISLNVQTAPTSTCAVEARLNGQAAGTVTLAAGRLADVDSIANPIAVERSDVLTFRTITGGGAKKATVMVEIILTP